MTDDSIDPTGPLTIGTIPDADLDAMIAATIVTPLLPAGATPDSEGFTGPPGNRTRVINTAPRPVPGRRDVRVIASAIQHGNARITDPAVIVARADSGLTPDDARALAALVLEAAAEVEGWLA